jgi:uncharacterized membrane protein
MIKKVLLILFIFIIMFSIHPVTSNALDSIKDADNFLNSGGKMAIDESTLRSISNTLYNTFLAIGIVVAVIVSSILGIQFITGSIETKAKVKESLVPFVVGCVVVFGAFGIWRLIVVIGEGLLT